MESDLFRQFFFDGAGEEGPGDEAAADCSVGDVKEPIIFRYSFVRMLNSKMCTDTLPVWFLLS